MLAYLITATFSECGSRTFKAIVVHPGSRTELKERLTREGWLAYRIVPATAQDVLDYDRYDNVLQDAKAEASRIRAEQVEEERRAETEGQQRIEAARKLLEQEKGPGSNGIEVIHQNQPRDTGWAKFRIRGAVQETGDEVTVLLQGTSIPEAIRKARGLGLLVEEVEVLEEQYAERRVSPLAPTYPREYRIEVLYDDAVMAFVVGQGHIQETKLQQILNAHGASGWELAFMFVETRRLLLFGEREALIVVMTRPRAQSA